MNTPSILKPAIDAGNPYPGIRPFEEEDAERFFGRDEEIEQLLNLVSSHRFVTVLGVSGSGKSSLVRAGVIPLMKLGMAENLSGRWRVATLTPGGTPLANLDRVLRKDFPSLPALVGEGPQTSFSLVEFAQSALVNRESLLLFVDQFEELFQFRRESLARDGGNEAALFVNLLLNAAGQRDVPIYVALAMRSDYLGESAQFRGLPEAMNDGHYLVPRLTRHQQQEAIERPLAELGVAMHPALVQRLLNDSAEEPDHLPVLQHLLKRIWEEHEPSKTRTIGFDEYKEAGGWKDAMNQDAEGVCKAFTEPGAEDGIRRLFQWITDQGPSALPVRRPANFSVLLEATKLESERLQKIIEAFQARGLLRGAGEELRAESRVDLPHESVAWRWTRLRNWIDEEARSVARLHFIQESKEKGMLLTGSALKEALELKQRMTDFPLWSNRYAADQTGEITAWIDCSLRTERRSRWRGRVTAILTAISLALGLFLYQEIRVAQSQKDLKNAADAGKAVAEKASAEQFGLRKKAETSEADAKRAVEEQARLRKVAEASRAAAERAAKEQARETQMAFKESKKANEESSAKVLVAYASDSLNEDRERSILLGMYAVNATLQFGQAPVPAAVEALYRAVPASVPLNLGGHSDAVTSVAFSPDGKHLATASYDNTAKVWDAVSGKELLTLRGHAGVLTGVAYSPDGKRLATASADLTAKVWDPATGKELLTLGGHSGTVTSVAFSPDGKGLATTSYDKTAKVWDAATGKELLTLGGHSDSVTSVAFSPDGKRLATASYDKTAKVWDAATGKQLLTLVGHYGAVSGVTFSADGKRLASASYDTRAKVWDVETGKELLTLGGHSDTVTSVAFNPDGRRLATASYDKTAKVWDAETGEELLVLDGHSDAVSCVGFSPDGKRLASAGRDAMVRVYVVDIHELLSLAHKQLTRVLTTDECERYFQSKICPPLP